MTRKSQKMENFLTAFPRKWVRKTIGLWPAFEWWNRLSMGTRVPTLRAFEENELRVISAKLGIVPTASVACIVPTYRRPEQLVSALNSILRQSYADFVVIVIDDGGGLPELPKDPRIFAVSLSKNSAVLGIVRNIGIRISNSRYIAFLDDDNTWTEKHLELTISALEEGADFVYSSIRRTMSDGTELDILSREYDRRELADGENYIDANAIVLRRSRQAVFSRLPRVKSTLPKEDWEFAFRLTRNRRVRHISTPTVEYLVNMQSYFTGWDSFREQSET
jgi:glycosyltransferase involved in cell wall biosynthesis